MSEHVFRNPDKIQQLPCRDFLRIEMPNGKDGFICEDLDLVLRWHSKDFMTDDVGMFALVEIKVGLKTALGHSKEMTFGMIDYLIRSSTESQRYKGFFVIRTTIPDWNACTFFSVNDVHLSRDDFLNWCKGTKCVDPYGFEKIHKRMGLPMDVKKEVSFLKNKIDEIQNETSEIKDKMERMYKLMMHLANKTPPRKQKIVSEDQRQKQKYLFG